MSTGEDDVKTPEEPDETAADETVAAPPPAVDGAAAAPEDPEDEDPWPFDEGGVFRIRRQEEIDLAPFTEDEPGEPTPLRFSSHDELTLDAFEKAVSRKIHERFGAPTPDAPAPSGAPKGADELVASVLSALTGKDARAALEEVRETLAARPGSRGKGLEGLIDRDALRGSLAAGPGGPERRGADIIDLGAAREARRRPAQSETAGRIGEVLKNTVSRFLEDYASQTGQATVNIDGEFLKAHGNQLLGNLFQGLAQALLPGAAKTMGASVAPLPGRGPVDVDELARWEAETAAAPAAEPEGAGDAAVPPDVATQQASEPISADVSPPDDAAAKSAPAPPPRPASVSVKVDLGSILANLFARRPKP